MALLTNIWFPNGGQITDFAGMTVYGQQLVPTVPNLAIPENAARLSLVPSPLGTNETICKFWHPASDSLINANGYKTQLTPAFTGANRDPITNWAGSGASRRWYRFKFMLASDFVFEKWNDSSQRCVLFQVHDTVDTTPPDFDCSPPLWLIAYPNGEWRFDITSCSATQTTSVNFLVRSPFSIFPKPGVPMEIILYVKWAWDNTGSIDIWVDRHKVFTESGIANCKNDDPARGGSGLFANLDIYARDDKLDRTVYYWGIQIGDESYANYAAFAAACGAGSELEPLMTNKVSIT